MLAFEANIWSLLKRKCCMWTFTLKDCHEPRAASKMWTKLLRRLREANPEWSGVRVYEFHPGRWGEFSHGLHVHLVSCRFFSDRLMHAIVKNSPWGRWQRDELVNQHAAFYIGKYLNKKRPGALHGMRLQACFGLDDYTRLRDIVIESRRGQCFRQLIREDEERGVEFAKRPWVDRLSMVRHLEFSVIEHGRQWLPDKCEFSPPPDRFAHRRKYVNAEFLDPGAAQSRKPKRDFETQPFASCN